MSYPGYASIFNRLNLVTIFKIIVVQHSDEGKERVRMESARRFKGGVLVDY